MCFISTVGFQWFTGFTVNVCSTEKNCSIFIPFRLIDTNTANNNILMLCIKQCMKQSWGGVDVQIFSDGSKESRVWSVCGGPSNSTTDKNLPLMVGRASQTKENCSDSAAGFDRVTEILIFLYRAENMGCEVGFCRYRGKSIKRECIWRITEEML